MGGVGEKGEETLNSYLSNLDSFQRGRLQEAEEDEYREGIFDILEVKS